jgi:hypothetical protein
MLILRFEATGSGVTNPSIGAYLDPSLCRMRFDLGNLGAADLVMSTAHP